MKGNETYYRAKLCALAKRSKPPARERYRHALTYDAFIVDCAALMLRFAYGAYLTSSPLKMPAAQAAQAAIEHATTILRTHYKLDDAEIRKLLLFKARRWGK